MKTSKLLIYCIITSLLFFIISCEKSDCAYDENESATHCDTPYGNNTERAGFTVVTCYADMPNGDVGVIYNTQNNSSAPVGDDWGNPASGTAVSAIHPANWKANEIGQVFGIAIDKYENIYLSTYDYYNNLHINVSSTSTANARIYKCVPPLYTAVLLTNFPSTTATHNEIGNIAYDKVNDQLFATNLDDGTIYRINTTTGAIINSYDPWTADSGGSGDGIVAQGEQVWGIGVNYEANTTKVYFPRVNGGTRELYSITLNSSGDFPVSGSETVEISNLVGSQNRVTDIAFSSNTNEMLITERGNPHASITVSYTRTGSTWNLNQQYSVGGDHTINGGNSAGGVDFAYKEVDEDLDANCDEFFWSTVNYADVLHVVNDNRKVYGIQGIDYN
ncbi:MAG: hypothetical protein V3U80_10815, partial [Flavobacteriaceae bacterium]